jgi:alpha-L-rhamnosidase
MPVDVGWKQVHIAPEPADLEFARGAVPTPLGMVRVEWEKVTEDQLAVRVELPQGMTGEFVGPLGESRTLVAGTHEFHT